MGPGENRGGLMISGEDRGFGGDPGELGIHKPIGSVRQGAHRPDATHSTMADHALGGSSGSSGTSTAASAERGGGASAEGEAEGAGGAAADDAVEAAAMPSTGVGAAGDSERGPGWTSTWAASHQLAMMSSSSLSSPSPEAIVGE